MRMKRHAHTNADAAYRAGIQALAQLPLPPGQRDRVWRLAEDLAGHNHLVTVKHLTAATAISKHQQLRRQAA
jgi:hypothetical protein